MDTGQQIRTLVTGGLHWPNALAIDFQGTVRLEPYTLTHSLRANVSADNCFEFIDLACFI